MGAWTKDLGRPLLFSRYISMELGQPGMNWYLCGMLALQMVA